MKKTSLHTSVTPSPGAELLPCCLDTPEAMSQVGRNTVTSGSPVTVTVTEPIPCYRRYCCLFSVCLVSGNQRRSCCRSRERPSVTREAP